MDHSISSLTAATVAVIPAETMIDLTECHPRIARALWWSILVDEAITREWVVNVGQRKAFGASASRSESLNERNVERCQQQFVTCLAKHLHAGPQFLNPTGCVTLADGELALATADLEGPRDRLGGLARLDLEDTEAELRDVVAVVQL